MKKSVIAHLSIWFGFFSLFIPIFLIIPESFQIPRDINLTLWGISLMITTVASFYGSFFFTKRFIIKNQKNVLFPLIFFIILIQSSVLLGVFDLIGGKDLILVFILTVVIILFVVLGGVLQFQMAWNNKNNQLRIELERQNHKSQIALLKSQINPHFLFNTLHNIDTLIRDNQDKASKSLIELSEIMRYMLQDTNSEFVSIEKEIKHIKNYISLERLRLKNEKFVTLQVNGDFKACKIAPMLFIPFIENAFKHSVDSDIEDGISIKLFKENNSILFTCENKYNSSELEKDKSHGIGLDTVKKRLEMIYPKAHRLTINQENSKFSVKLEISTNEN